eukprot:999068-Amphidinium_carterae.2
MILKHADTSRFVSITKERLPLSGNNLGPVLHRTFWFTGCQSNTPWGKDHHLSNKTCVRVCPALFFSVRPTRNTVVGEVCKRQPNPKALDFAASGQ